MNSHTNHLEQNPGDKGNTIELPDEDLDRDDEEPWSPDNDLPKTPPPLGDVPLK